MLQDSPPDFESQFNQTICKLQKSLYDLKQSPRAWFERFAQFIKKLGDRCSASVPGHASSIKTVRILSIDLMELVLLGKSCCLASKHW